MHRADRERERFVATPGDGHQEPLQSVAEALDRRDIGGIELHGQQAARTAQLARAEAELRVVDRMR